MEELIPITMFMCIAAVAILRPISKRLGGLLEVMTRERQTSQTSNDDLARLRVLMEHVANRIDLVEERLDFTERLLSTGPRSQTSLSSIARADRAELLRERTAEIVR